MDLSELSKSEVAYIETMYRLKETNDSASVSVLAKRFDVKMPTAIEILNKLEEKGLVIRRPWKIPELSKRGILIAESVMHQHRIVELYFNTKLGLDSTISCAEASKIDYLLDNAVVQKMCKVLNRPSRCHHGNRIQHKED